MSHVPHQAAGRKRHRYREQELQRAVLEHLHWRGQRDAYWFHPPNGGWRSPAEARIFTSLGVRAGTPDLILIRRGSVFGLELKSATGKLSDAQCDAHEAMRRAGAIVHTANSIDDAVGWLELQGLLRGRMQRSGAAADDGWQRFRQELAAAPTRDAATEVFHRHDALFLGMSCAERERCYAEVEDIIHEKPSKNSHCQVRVSVPAPSGKHTERN